VSSEIIFTYLYIYLATTPRRVTRNADVVCLSVVKIKLSVLFNSHFFPDITPHSGSCDEDTNEMFPPRIELWFIRPSDTNVGRILE
jgi:hypothetical protein